MCADGDNDFAESVHENSLLKKSEKNSIVKPHEILSTNQSHNDFDITESRLKLSSNYNLCTPRAIEMNQGKFIDKQKELKNGERKKNSQDND